MDPQELAALMGFPTDMPQGEAGTGMPGELALAPVGRPEDTFSAFGAPEEAYSPNSTPLTPNQGYIPPPAPIQVRPGQSQGYSTSGYSPNRAQAIEVGPYGSRATKGKIDAEQANIRNRYGELKSDYEEANRGQLEAENQMSRAEEWKLIGTAELKQKEQALYMQHAQDFDKLNESTLIAKQQARDEYRSRLMSIPEVNPNAMWDEAGSEGQLAIAASAFIHEMLNVKGIKTSAMDTINNAIKNKIDAQIANINTKKAVAAGFKDLYDMTVQESASKMEVQAKMHGYMLRAFEAGVDAKMGAYDSNVARAKHQQAKMALRQAQIKNMAAVEQLMDHALDQAAQRQITLRGQSLQYSIAKMNNESAEKIAGMKNDKTTSPLEDVIFDTTESGGTEAKRLFLPGMSADKKAEIRLQNGQASSALAGLRGLIKLQKNAGKERSALGATRFESEEKRLANSAGELQGLLVAYAKSGKTLGPYEVDVYNKIFSLPKWWTNGDNIRIIAQAGLALKKENDSKLESVSYEIPEGHSLKGKRSGKSTMGGAEEIDLNEYANPAPKTDRELAEERLGESSAFYPDESTSKEEQGAWDTFKKANPETAKVLVKPSKGQQFLKDTGTFLPDDPFKSTKPPHAHNDVYFLALAAVKGDDKSKAALEKLANPGSSTPSQLKEYEPLAKYYLEWVDTQSQSQAPGQ